MTSERLTLMNLAMRSFQGLLIPMMVLSLTDRAVAQLDRVYDQAEDNVSGTVIQVSKQGVVLKRGGNNQEFQAGLIGVCGTRRKVRHQLAMTTNGH